MKKKSDLEPLNYKLNQNIWRLSSSQNQIMLYPTTFLSYCIWLVLFKKKKKTKKTTGSIWEIYSDKEVKKKLSDPPKYNR